MGSPPARASARPDGEPQGTAGLPMMEVLKKRDVLDVLVISTRYFGGILRGAGGAGATRE